MRCRGHKLYLVLRIINLVIYYKLINLSAEDAWLALPWPAPTRSIFQARGGEERERRERERERERESQRERERETNKGI